MWALLNWNLWHCQLLFWMEPQILYTSSCWLVASQHQLKRYFKNFRRWLDAEMAVFSWKVGSFSIALSSMAWGWPIIWVKLRGWNKASIGLRGFVAIFSNVSKNLMSEIDLATIFSSILWDSSLCNIVSKTLSASGKSLNTLCQFILVEYPKVILNCGVSRWTEQISKLFD